MIDKKLICWIIFSGVGIWIGRISWFRYKSFTKMLKYARSDIVYGVAEAKELLKEFPDQKYIYIQGYALPNEKDQTRFMGLTSTVQHSRKLFTTRHQVNSFNLVDHITKSDRMQIFVDSKIGQNQSLIDYNRKTVYQAAKLNFIQKILLKIPFLREFSRAQIVEKQYGSQFGQYFIIFGEHDGNNFKAQYYSKQYQRQIYQQLLKDKKNAEILPILGMLISFIFQLPLIIRLIFFTYKRICKYRENNKMLPCETLQKSVSVILNSQNDADICVVCLTRIRSIIFEPCLHLVVCQECVDHLQAKTCPVCRLKIDRTIKVIYQQ